MVVLERIDAPPTYYLGGASLNYRSCVTCLERDALAAEIRQRGIRRREFERFITTLESLPDEVTDFSEDLWGSLVEYLTVYAKDDLRFMLPCEVEIEA